MWLIQGWIGGKRNHDVWIAKDGWTWTKDSAVRHANKEEIREYLAKHGNWGGRITKIHVFKEGTLEELAEDALEALKQREGEDIDEWAKRLAYDVKDADD